MLFEDIPGDHLSKPVEKFANCRGQSRCYLACSNLLDDDAHVWLPNLSPLPIIFYYAQRCAYVKRVIGLN